MTTDRSSAEMLAETAVLLAAHAKEHGLAVREEETDVEQVLMLARSIRYGWPAGLLEPHERRRR